MLQLEASSVWVDFLAVPVVPDPTSTVAAAPPPTSGTASDGGGAVPIEQQGPVGPGRRAPRATVVVSLHEREGGEVEAKAWELRHVVVRGDQARKKAPTPQQHHYQQPACEWKAIEVEVEVPLRLEKTLDHWRQAAASATATSTSTTASSTSSSSSSSPPLKPSSALSGGTQPAVSGGEGGGAQSGSFSYLHAAKGRKDGEDQDDDDYQPPTYTRTHTPPHPHTTYSLHRHHRQSGATYERDAAAQPHRGTRRLGRRADGGRGQGRGRDLRVERCPPHRHARRTLRAPPLSHSPWCADDVLFGNICRRRAVGSCD